MLRQKGKRLFFDFHAAVLDPVAHFGGLGIVKSVKGANEIAGDAADPFKLHSAAHKDVAAIKRRSI